MTARKNPPLLRFGFLAGRVYIVTRYVINDGRVIVAKEKFDVTEDFLTIVNLRRQWDEENGDIPDDPIRIAERLRRHEIGFTDEAVHAVCDALIAKSREATIE